MARLNFRGAAVDNAGVDQVSRPMQIALVAVVLLAGMWFTVLKPKPADETVTPAVATPAPAATTASPSPDKVAPGVKGLASAVDKAKGAAAKSDAVNAKVQAATGSATPSATAAKPAAAKPAATKAVAAQPATTKATATKTAAKAKATTTTAKAKAKAPAAKVATDPSDRLLAFLAKGKTLVILFEGKGADDKVARKAVHETAKADPKHVVSAYVPISDVGDYEKITSDVQVFAAPSILVIGADRKATLLTGYVDVESVRQAVGDARREAAAAKAAAKK